MSDDVKRLYRSNDDRWLGGVCGGLAKYFGIDSTLVRLIFILLALIIGGGLLIYIIMWIIIPQEPDGASVDMLETAAEEEPEEKEPAPEEPKEEEA